MFVDASAIVAIITREPDADSLADALDAASAPFTSPVAIYEAVLAIHRIKRGGLRAAQTDVTEFLRLTGMRVAPLTDVEGDLAIQAHARFGKGRGHKVRLNMGDCFAYACAQAAGCTLLFKGDDFSHTDIRSAVA